MANSGSAAYTITFGDRAENHFGMEGYCRELLLAPQHPLLDQSQGDEGIERVVEADAEAETALSVEAS